MSDAPEGEPAHPRHILEQGRRLSRSLLWPAQRAFFEQQGINAWSEGIVPHYITSNPFIADAYAKVILGWLRDCHRRPRTPPEREDREERAEIHQPFYIVELGAGSGRFSFHLLRRLKRILASSTFRDTRVKYVMTDLAQRNIDFWRGHASLRPFVESGLLDFARFDAVGDDRITLLESGETLTAGSVANPLCAIANYFFDSIPQDAFQIREGRLHESLISVSSSQEEADLLDPSLLGRLETTWEQRPVEGDYYGDPALDRLLLDYQERLGDTAFQFPSSAIGCIRSLCRLSGDRLLLLSSDKGHAWEEELLHLTESELVVHGSFSLMVNYHAIARYFENQGGRSLAASRRSTGFQVCGFMLDGAGRDHGETAQAFDEALSGFNPDDFCAIKKLLEQQYETLTLPQWLSVLRFCHWDPSVLLAAYPIIGKHLESASPVQRQELYVAIQRSWEAYYPIGERHDLAFGLGMLLFQLEHHVESLRLFEHSLRLQGPHPVTLYNMGLCHNLLQRPEEALSCFRQVLVLDPASEPARVMRIRLEAELERRAG